MSPELSGRDGRLVALAYRLGYAAVDFERRARMLWEAAEQGEPFPVELDGFAQDLLHLNRELAPLLPERTGRPLVENLRKAVARALKALDKDWLGTEHLAALDLLDRAEPEMEVDPFDPSPFEGQEWADLRRAIDEFSRSLPLPLADSASLGVHVAAARDVLPSGKMLRGTRHLVAGPPFFLIEDIASALSDHCPPFREININISDESYLRADASPGMTLWEWRQSEVRRLHRAILDLNAKIVPVEHEGEWIAANEASRLAEVHFGVMLSLPDISKLASDPKPPFKTRPRMSPKNYLPMRNRREVEFTSLVKYLLDRREAEGIQPADQAATGNPGGQTSRARSRDRWLHPLDRPEPSAEEQAGIARRIAEEAEQRKQRRLKDSRDKGQLDKGDV